MPVLGGGFPERSEWAPRGSIWVTLLVGTVVGGLGNAEKGKTLAGALESVSMEAAQYNHDGTDRLGALATTFSWAGA